MRRFILPALLLLCTVLSAQENRFAPLDSLLVQFYASMEREDVDSKNAEVDFLIGSCKDSLVRQHVAVSIFDHYRDSKLMGEESVAIHVYDEWFETGKTSFLGDLSKMDAEVFVKFNRNSQIGNDAPRVTLYKPCGGKLTIPEKGRTALLFFYDTHCAKCKLELQLLPAMLEKVDFDLNVYLVNSSSTGDRAEWKAFRKNVKLKNRHVRIVHLWDPELESGYEFEYGVVATPRVFVVEPQGTIIGRRLEMENLPEIFAVAGAIQATYDKFK